MLEVLANLRRLKALKNILFQNNTCLLYLSNVFIFTNSLAFIQVCSGFVSVVI